MLTTESELICIFALCLGRNEDFMVTRNGEIVTTL